LKKITGNKVYVNGRFLCNKIDGISRFSIEICKQLKRLNLDFIIIIPSWLEYENHENFNMVKFGKLKSHLWEQLDLPRFLYSKGSPLLINFSGLGPLFYRNQIITIHDLSFYVNKTWFSKSFTLFYSFCTPIVSKNAKKILTVSNFSKQQINEYLNITEDKIEVVYNAVSSSLISGYKTENVNPYIQNILDSKYILAVSSLDSRKNQQRLIDAFINLKLDDYRLILVGKSLNHFNVELDVKSQNIIFTGHVSDFELIELYKNCIVFVYPSLYEGFGIPPLEAMRNKCPVIVSDIPSLKEVCSDSAYYINPYSTSDISNGLKAVLNDLDLRKELSIKGHQRSELFKWEDSGEKVYQIIKTINRSNF
jgi:glycosyltransferase involved in cell wall biosynthesis